MVRIREKWLEKTVFPVRRIWKRVTIRLGIRDSGLLKLQHDVHSCEYEDIRIMWNLLQLNEELARSPRSKKKTCWNLIEWAKRAPCLCRGF